MTKTDVTKINSLPRWDDKMFVYSPSPRSLEIFKKCDNKLSGGWRSRGEVPKTEEGLIAFELAMKEAQVELIRAGVGNLIPSNPDRIRGENTIKMLLGQIAMLKARMN